jgi:hypothetical protein
MRAPSRGSYVPGIIVALACLTIGSASVASQSKKSDTGKKKPALHMPSVPHGTSWHCWTAYNPYDPTDAVSGCARTEAACEAERDSFADSSMLATEVSDCREQPKASVFTYYSVMHETHFASIYRSTEHCKSSRRLRARLKNDYRNISECTAVGKRERERLNRNALPKGKGWHCTAIKTETSFGLSECFRKQTACETAINGKVVELTSGEVVHPQCISWAPGWATSMGNTIRVFGAQHGCEMLISSISTASRCEEVE